MPLPPATSHSPPPNALSTHYAAAFITGASSGIGRAIAEMLLDNGVRVWGTARDTARLAPLAAKHPAAFTPLALDLDAPDAAQAALETATRDATALDLVVNNAGYGLFAPFDETPFAPWKAQIDAMLATTARLAHTAFRAMRARNRGCLVNVSSLAVDFPLPYMTGYNIAKAGLSALSASLAFEARGTAVRVIDFRPGDYRTAFNHAMHPAPPRPAAPADSTTPSATLTAPAAPAASPRVAAVWRTIDAQFNSAPPPARAARDLRRALLRKRTGTVRSGAFFQATLAPLAARLLPQGLLRAIGARYFGAA